MLVLVLVLGLVLGLGLVLLTSIGLSEYEKIVFGELGLTGELRPVANGQERLREASKHGFKHAIVPFANRPKERIGNMTIHGVKTLAAALEVVSTL